MTRKPSKGSSLNAIPGSRHIPNGQPDSRCGAFPKLVAAGGDMFHFSTGHRLIFFDLTQPHNAQEVYHR